MNVVWGPPPKLPPPSKDQPARASARTWSLTSIKSSSESALSRRRSLLFWTKRPSPASISGLAGGDGAASPDTTTGNAPPTSRKAQQRPSPLSQSSQQQQPETKAVPPTKKTDGAATRKPTSPKPVEPAIATRAQANNRTRLSIPPAPSREFSMSGRGHPPSSAGGRSTIDLALVTPARAAGLQPLPAWCLKMPLVEVARYDPEGLADFVRRHVQAFIRGAEDRGLLPQGASAITCEGLPVLMPLEGSVGTALSRTWSKESSPVDRQPEQQQLLQQEQQQQQHQQQQQKQQSGHQDEPAASQQDQPARIKVSPQQQPAFASGALPPGHVQTPVQVPDSPPPFFTDLSSAGHSTASSTATDSAAASSVIASSTTSPTTTTATTTSTITGIGHDRSAAGGANLLAVQPARSRVLAACTAAGTSLPPFCRFLEEKSGLLGDTHPLVRGLLKASKDSLAINMDALEGLHWLRRSSSEVAATQQQQQGHDSGQDGQHQHQRRHSSHLHHHPGSSSASVMSSSLSSSRETLQERIAEAVGHLATEPRLARLLVAYVHATLVTPPSAPGGEGGVGEVEERRVREAKEVVGAFLSPLRTLLAELDGTYAAGFGEGGGASTGAGERVGR